MKDKIVLDNLGLIYKAIKDLNCIIKNEEDLEEYYYAGLFGLINASKKYNKELSNTSFLYKSIKNRIIHRFHMNSAQRRIPRKYIYMIGDTINELGTPYRFEEVILTEIYVNELLNKLKEKNYKQFLIEYYGINTPALTMVEIAQKYNVSKQYVHQAIHRGLKLLKKIIMEEK